MDATAKVVKGKIVIELDIKRLPGIVEHGPTGLLVTPKFARKLAREIADKLNEEDPSTGSNVIQTAIDDAIQEVYEDGSESLYYPED